MKRIAVVLFSCMGLLLFSLDVLASKCTPAEEPSIDDVSVYEPVYFIVGGDGGLNAKFQISFKYQITNDHGWLRNCLHIPANLYLSYSQTSLWDLHDRSNPFKDTSYRPRLFYGRDSIWQISSRWNLGLEAGLAHESNGKADSDSRSINLGYVRPTLSYAMSDHYRVYIAPMIYSYIDKGENPDINDYRGNVDLLIGIGDGNDGTYGWNAWTVLRKGDRGHYGSVEANVAVPFKYISFGYMNGWLLLQYFNGWGESLLDYNKKLTSQFRAGFAIRVQ